MDGEGAMGAGGGAGIIGAWLQRHREKYACATRHPFILGIREGTVDLSSFRRWLGQDYIFVREFVPFLASVLLKGWKKSDSGMDMEVILGGMASLHDELSWFKKEAAKWDVQLSAIVPQRANRDYCRHSACMSASSGTLHCRVERTGTGRSVVEAKLKPPGTRNPDGFSFKLHVGRDVTTGGRRKRPRHGSVRADPPPTGVR